MKIVRGFPPNYAEISRTFNLTGRNVVFAYGNILYNPAGNEIPDHLRVHEETHEAQQARFPGGVTQWWKKYLVDKDFRLYQEVEAYRTQFRFLKQRANRSRCRTLLHFFASELCSPLYGNLTNFEDALKLISEEE